jgi:hypothetical protein
MSPEVVLASTNGGASEAGFPKSCLQARIREFRCTINTVLASTDTRIPLHNQHRACKHEQRRESRSTLAPCLQGIGRD